MGSKIFWENISPSSKDFLESQGKTIAKSRGEVLVLGGETVLGLYVLLEGEVGVYPLGSNSSLASLHPGMIFGELSFIEDQKASATVRVSSSGAKVLFIKKEMLQSEIRMRPELGADIYYALSVAIAQKLRATTTALSTQLDDIRKEIIGAVGFF